MPPCYRHCARGSAPTVTAGPPPPLVPTRGIVQPSGNFWRLRRVDRCSYDLGSSCSDISSCCNSRPLFVAIGGEVAGPVAAASSATDVGAGGAFAGSGCAQTAAAAVSCAIPPAPTRALRKSPCSCPCRPSAPSLCPPQRVPLEVDRKSCLDDRSCLRPFFVGCWLGSCGFGILFGFGSGR